MRISLILSIFNFFLIILIFFQLKTHRPVKSIGFFVIFTQIAIIFSAVVTRALGPGFNPFILLGLTLVPAFLPLISKFFSKFKKKNQELNLFQKFNYHVDQAFFNVLNFNVGLYFLSKKAFMWIEKSFRERIKTPHILINKILIYPWIVFLSTAILEIICFNHSYFGPVLLGLNLLIFRLTILVFRIIERTANENLEYIYSEFFQSDFKKPPQPYYIQFVHEETLISILDNNNVTAENIINKGLGVIMGNCFASAVLQSKILKNYLVPLYFMQLNRASAFVLLGLIFPSFFLVFSCLAISCLGTLFFETKYLHVNQLIYHLLRLNNALLIYRETTFKQLSEIDADVSRPY